MNHKAFWHKKFVAISKGVAVGLIAIMIQPAASQAAMPKPSEPGYARPIVGHKPHNAALTPKPMLPSQKKPIPKPRGDGPAIDIVGGTAAGFGEFPYFVSLQRSANGTGDFFCGGSLLSTTKVLTAAHCVSGANPASLQVTIGGTTLIPNDGVVRNISAVAVSPAWNSFTRENDVAILTLATPVLRTDWSAQWLRLAQGNELGLVDPGDTAVVIGHGAVCEVCATSNELLKVGVPIQSDATMSAAYGSEFFGSTMVGAGPLSGGQDSCQGDSGGPLLITSTPQDIQVGNVSWGFGCARAGLPGVYGELYQGAMSTFVNSQIARPSNDQFNGAITLGGNSGSIAGSNENATTDPGESSGETTVWHSWTPSVSGNAQIAVNQHGFDSEVDVYTGSSVQSLTLVAHNDDANGTLQSEVEFNAVAGTTYRVRVDGYAFDFGAYRLSYGVNRPANDDFVTAQTLNGVVGGPIGASTNAATGEAGEPSPIIGSADASLWYTWTAPESGNARFTTAGSGYDTTLAAYTGSSVQWLIQAAANDDANGTLQSLISFPVTANTVYRIQVGGYAGLRGTAVLQFSVNPQPNDLFSTAQVISGAAGTVFGENSRAIGEPGEPAFGSVPDTSVWYRWTAPFSGPVQFRTCGSTFDTVLAAATGVIITALQAVASNDDSSCGLQSVIDFVTTAGTTYQIWVDGYSAGRGSIVLSWS